MTKVIYSIFIGILFATFVGVGIAAFYEKPVSPEYPKTLIAEDRALTPAPECEKNEECKKYQEEQRKFEAAQKEYEKQTSIYSRNVSLVALAAALLALVISLTFLKSITVIADGLLLGGVFTLIYSIGWSFAAGEKKFIFAVVSVGMLVSLVLGYLKFIRPTQAKPAK